MTSRPGTATGRRTRRRALLAAAPASLLALAAPASAGEAPVPAAPPGAVITLDPPTVVAGDTFRFTATGCTADGVPQDELVVAWVWDWDMVGGDLPTDSEGSATFVGTADDGYVPELRLGGGCTRVTPEGREVVFAYETAFLGVQHAAAPTPPAAPVASAQPRFTG
jgi:hypothetical protein